MLFTLPFPAIDPVLIEIGPLAIRWYALAYIVGLLVGWRYCLWLAGRPPHRVNHQQIDDFFLWAVLGVILGGRIGYVLFYQLAYYLDHPADILFVWQGGMSFHGGLAGVILAMLLFARRHGIPFFALSDIVACATPIGLFLGRLANFVNGELFGRPTDVPWAMVFREGDVPRHPSQLYEAALEGVVLFAILFVLARFTRAAERIGVLSGVFLIGYGVSRIVVELFRQPDIQLGFLIGGATMGQLLSLPMIAFGAWLVLRGRRAHPAPPARSRPRS